MFGIAECRGCAGGDPQRDNSAWVPPVLRLIASENRQVPELATAIDAFIAWSERAGRKHRLDIDLHHHRIARYSV